MYLPSWSQRGWEIFLDKQRKTSTEFFQVESNVNVSDLTTSSTLTDDAHGPSCRLTVTNEADESIAAAVVGQALRLRLEVSPNGKTHAHLFTDKLQSLLDSRDLLHPTTQLLRHQHRDWGSLLAHRQGRLCN